MLSHESAIIFAAIMISFLVAFGLMFQAHAQLPSRAHDEYCKAIESIVDLQKTDREQ